MKLVTGIEAIQSGKPWKHKNDTGWIKPEEDILTFTPRYLALKEFIIKEEPREFWIDLSSTSHWFAYSTQAVGDHSKDENWIRVREVEK